MRIFYPAVFICMLILTLAGCSSGHSSHVTYPDDTSDYSLADSNTQSDSPNHKLLGAWNVSFDLENLSAEISQSRECKGHYDVTQYLPAPLITINSYDPLTSIVDVDLTVFNTSDISGFDVRLIVFTDDIGHMLLNEDNWTILYDKPGGLPINPFKAYAKTEDYRVFPPQTLRTENYQILLPGGNPDVTIAIDASFPENCVEPYQMHEYLHYVLCDFVGASAKLQVTIESWKDDVNAAYLYCPEITDVNYIPLAQVDDTKIWEGYIVNNNDVPEGEYTGFLFATTWDSNGLALYHEATITVTQRGRWARTWGGKNYDYAIGTVLDSEGNIYTAGWFEDLVDFDPGPGVVEFEAHGFRDIFLSKFDTHGFHIWTKVWGWLDSDMATDIRIDNEDFIYVTGTHEDRTDMDPGPDVYEITSNGGKDTFMSKFDTDGNFIWALSWGGISDDYPQDVQLDEQNNIHLVGILKSTVDLDPTDGVDEHTCAGGYGDAYISKFDSDGNFLWARSWGGEETDRGISIAVDNAGRIFVAGTFNGIVDFDPGNGLCIHISEGNDDDDSDIFISKFDSSGDHYWTNTLGSVGENFCTALRFDGNDQIYLAGTYVYTVDFAPGPDVVERTSPAHYGELFIAKYNLEGYLTWVITGNCLWVPRSSNFIFEDTGNFYISGWFSGVVDFDTGPVVNERTANTYGDAFISIFSPDNIHIDVYTFGGDSYDGIHGINFDENGDLFAAGFFYETVDFDLTDGVDEQISHGDSDAYLTRIMLDQL